MRNNKDFDSLENWADRNLKKLGPVVAPQGFLDGVMDKVHAPNVAYITPENPSLLIIWMRTLVVCASLLLLVGGFFWDPAWVQNWWSNTSPGMTLNLMGQLFTSLKQLGASLLDLVPSVVWVGLSISLAVAYLITALIGSAIFHFTSRKVRIQSV